MECEDTETLTKLNMNMAEPLVTHEPSVREEIMEFTMSNDNLRNETMIEALQAEETAKDETTIEKLQIDNTSNNEITVEKLQADYTLKNETTIDKLQIDNTSNNEITVEKLQADYTLKNETTIGKIQINDTLKNETIEKIQINDILKNETTIEKIQVYDLPKSDTTMEGLQAEDTEKLSETQNKEILMNIEKENGSREDAEVKQSTNWFYYKWNNPPKLLCKAAQEYQPTELCENFTKGCQWSPDGTCLLVPSEDFRLRIYELPRELYSEQMPSSLSCTNFPPALTIKEGGLIYDTCWYPFMNSWDPATCCFLSTSRESPIHLWDAFNGELRATYRAYNQVDEVEASISIQFIDSAKEVWAGFKNALRIFDMERPGRQIDTIQFKKDFPNVRGLVSCIRENPIMPGLVAFGTYSKCIGLYRNGPLCSFETGSGVTQIEFSPCGTKLFSAVRRNNEFLCWDLRNPGMILYSLQGRQSGTNQRIQFSLAPDGKYIISGGTNGDIIVWELPECTDCEDLNLMYKVNLSSDCINGISLHRTLPIMATSTGQRLCDSIMQSRDNSVQLWSFS